jgi:hypothetical protein
MIMRKSLFAAMALCAAGLTFSSYAQAYPKFHRHSVRIAENQPSRIAEYGRQGYPTQFRIPAHPLIWDCVHVTFPQCGRGFDGLNDGSFR